MEIKTFQAIIEAILFASGEPVETERLCSVLALDDLTVTKIADDYMHQVNTRDGGIKIVKLGNCYQMCSREEFAEYIRKTLDMRRNIPLSNAAMEVLAIVSYNQPVTRAFVDQVRGVDCGAVIQGLIIKNLIEEKGRLELPGRPLLYGTTNDFLRSFSISSLKELPPLPRESSDDEMDETTLEEIIDEKESSFDEM